MLKTIALAFFIIFWLVVVVRLLMRSPQLDQACAQIPLDNDVTTPRTLPGDSLPEDAPSSSLPRTDR